MRVIVVEFVVDAGFIKKRARIVIIFSKYDSDIFHLFGMIQIRFWNKIQCSKCHKLR